MKKEITTEELLEILKRNICLENSNITMMVFEEDDDFEVIKSWLTLNLKRRKR